MDRYVTSREKQINRLRYRRRYWTLRLLPNDPKAGEAVKALAKINSALAALGCTTRRAAKDNWKRSERRYWPT